MTSDTEKLLKELKIALQGEKQLPISQQDASWQKMIKQQIDELQNKLVINKMEA